MQTYRKSYKRKPRKCPECGHIPVANIMYGMPIMDKKLEENLANGVVSLGGCCDAGIGPDWKCMSCDKVFHKIPKQRTFIRLRVDQYMTGSFELIIDDYGSTIDLGFNRLEAITVDRNVIDELTDLVNTIDIFAWEKEYKNSNILDGMGWELEVNIKGQYINSMGINAYPDGFEKLQTKIENIVKSVVDVDEL